MRCARGCCDRRPHSTVWQLQHACAAASAAVPSALTVQNSTHTPMHHSASAYAADAANTHAPTPAAAAAAATHSSSTHPAPKPKPSDSGKAVHPGMDHAHSSGIQISNRNTPRQPSNSSTALSWHPRAMRQGVASSCYNRYTDCLSRQHGRELPAQHARVGQQTTRQRAPRHPPCHWRTIMACVARLPQEILGAGRLSVWRPTPDDLLP